MKNLFLLFVLLCSMRVLAQENYSLTWCDRKMDAQTDVKFEMSCLNSIPTITNQNGETLVVKNFRIEFAEGDLVIQAVRNAESKLDQRIFGILKQSTGFASGRIYDLIVMDSKGKVHRIDQSYRFTVTK